MIDIITAKLEQHPELIEGIDERGGILYLEKCTHNTVKNDTFWESGEDKQNGFIRALIEAYKNVSNSNKC